MPQTLPMWGRAVGEGRRVPVKPIGNPGVRESREFGMRVKYVVPIVLVVVLALVLWPLFGLKRIADAVEARDAERFTRLLDIPELKRSLGGQIARAHLQLISGHRLSPLALSLASQAGMAAADAYVVEIIKAQSLFDLLKPARLESFAGTSVGPQAWRPPNLRNAGRLLASELRGRNFYVLIPLSAEPKDQFRLRLRLQQWRWKIAGVELPVELQQRLARDFAARIRP
jgi:hypothetical protein